MNEFFEKLYEFIYNFFKALFSNTPDPEPEPSLLKSSFTIDLQEGKVPFTVTCNSTSTPSDGTIVSHSWDWDDGSEVSKGFTNVQHTYNEEGSYDILLTVKDKDGNIDHSYKTITVLPKDIIVDPDPDPIDGEIEEDVIHKLCIDSFNTEGMEFPIPVTSKMITDTKMFDYTTRGFGNGYKNRHLLQIQKDYPGIPKGVWIETIRPGGKDAHTWGKVARAVKDMGKLYKELFCKTEIFIPEGWATHTQGKLGYGWSNPDGNTPGSSNTNNIEWMLHWFSPNHQKKSDLWPTLKPSGPYSEQAFVLGFNVYALDSRITNDYSEPLFIVNDVEMNDFEQVVFDKGDHLLLWCWFKTNTPGNKDGIIKVIYSKDGGKTYKLGVDIEDMEWSNNDNGFQDTGFVQFRGGNGPNDEPGNYPSQNTGKVLEDKDYHLFLKEVRTQLKNPLPNLLKINKV